MEIYNTLVLSKNGLDKLDFVSIYVKGIFFESGIKDNNIVIINKNDKMKNLYPKEFGVDCPVIYDMEKGVQVLKLFCGETQRRYKTFEEFGVLGFNAYDNKVKTLADFNNEQSPFYMPRVVIIIDGLVDLLEHSKEKIEDALCRLLQISSAAGIHVIACEEYVRLENVDLSMIEANFRNKVTL